MTVNVSGLPKATIFKTPVKITVFKSLLEKSEICVCQDGLLFITDLASILQFVSKQFSSLLVLFLVHKNFSNSRNSRLL